MIVESGKGNNLSSALKLKVPKGLTFAVASLVERVAVFDPNGRKSKELRRSKYAPFDVTISGISNVFIDPAELAKLAVSLIE